MHRDRTENRANTIVFNSQLENMTNDVRNYMSELNSENAMIKDLKIELESSHFLSMQLKLENEEFSIMLLVLKLGISKAHVGFQEERENATSLSKRIEAMDFIDNQQLLMQTKVGKYKEMLEDLSNSELKQM